MRYHSYTPIGYLLLSISSRPVRKNGKVEPTTKRKEKPSSPNNQSLIECECYRYVQGEDVGVKDDSISITKGDVVEVYCRTENTHTAINWETNLNSESFDVTSISHFVQILRIESASVEASQNKMEATCNLTDNEKATIFEQCCRLTIRIKTNKTNTKPTMTATKTLTATLPQNRTNFTTTNVYSATAAPTNHSYATEEQERPNSTTLSSTSASTTTNHSYVNVTSFQTSTSRHTATISAVCVATALLISVLAAVLFALKRKRLSNNINSNDNSTDNLNYLLDVKEPEIWNGNKIIPIDCLLVGKSLGKTHSRSFVKHKFASQLLSQGKGNLERWLKEN